MTIELLRRAYGIEVKAVAGDPRAFDVIASTDDVDIQGEVLAQDWDLRRYTKNPVVLYYHNMRASQPRDTLPIGYSDNVGVIDGKLRARIHFVTAEAGELAELCCQGFRQGSLKAVSVGFKPKLVQLEIRGDKDVFVLSGNELIEISVCPIPVNPNTVADEAKALDTERHDLRELAKATTTPTPTAEPPGTNQQEQPKMKIVAKTLGLKEDASEAEVLSAVGTIQSAGKAVEARVLEATGAKTLDEAVGIIKAAVLSTEQLATTRIALNGALSEVETRDRTALIAQGVADLKITPALKAWAEEKSPEGKFLVSLQTLTGFLKGAAPNAVLASQQGNKPIKPGDEPPPQAGAKAWEALTPAEKHNLNVTEPAQYAALKADWERRGKPAMTYGKKNAA